MNTYKKLMGNSIIFAIGNLGSKLITFLLLPLYTHYLTTNEYGLVDMVTTTTSLLLPILSANIFEAVLRFALDKEEDKQKVLSNSLFVAVIGVILTLLTTFVLNYFIVNKKILVYIIVILILQIYRSIFSQFARAINKVKLFAVDGIIMTFVTAIANIILLTIFHLGIDGYLISLVIANLISILFLMLVMRVWKFINFSKIDRGYSKEMLLYSVPMIPNSIMWWLISAANRYFILFFIGPSANGIFAAANKIPSIVNIFSTIFGQAWQMSAIEEGNNEEKGKFYSNVFSFYSSGLFIVTAGIIMIYEISSGSCVL
ncbi:MAG: oligosaccharide flippase family protein [Coprobacillus sp.]